MIGIVKPVAHIATDGEQMCDHISWIFTPKQMHYGGPSRSRHPSVHRLARAARPLFAIRTQVRCRFDRTNVHI